MWESLLANGITEFCKELFKVDSESRAKFLLFLTSKAKKIGLDYIYPKSEDSFREFEEFFKKSTSVKIMQIRGTELIENNIKRFLQYRKDDKFETKILLLNPNSIHVSTRAEKIKKSTIGFAADIRSNIRKLEDYISREKLNVEFCLYSKEPIFNIHMFDEFLFLSFYSDIEAKKGKERHSVNCYKISKGTLLYEAIEKYFTFVWEEESSPIDELKDHFEVEKKFLVEDADQLLKAIENLKGVKISEAYYEDYYFTKTLGRHYGETEREYRIRADLNTKKVYLTKKRLFSKKFKESKFEMESYIGYYSKIKYILSRVKNNGYMVYSSFRKMTLNYEVKMPDVRNNSANADVTFIFSIATLKENNYYIDSILFNKIFLEIETLVPAKTKPERIEELNKMIDDIGMRLKKCISPCDTKYSEICKKR